MWLKRLIITVIAAQCVISIFATTASAKDKWHLKKGDDPDVYRAFGVMETVCIAHTGRVRIKIFEAQIRVHYEHYDSGTTCFTALGVNTKIYVRAEDKAVDVGVDADESKAWAKATSKF